MNIAYFGSGAFGLPTLDALRASRHKIVAVISQPDRPAGRGNHLEPTPAKAWASRHELPVLTAPDVNAPDIIDHICALRPILFW